MSYEQPSSETPKPTVSFNVGGKVYEVSKSLLTMHPESLLVKKTSEATDEESSPIFIDRDPDRFGYCLDYMRDGKVHLPGTMTKKSLLEELKLFGFGDVDEKSISTNEAALGWTAAQVFDRLKEERKDLQSLQQKTRAKAFAIYLIMKFLESTSKSISINRKDLEKEGKDEEFHSIDNGLLNDVLSKFGLQAHISYYSNGTLKVHNATVRKKM